MLRYVIWLALVASATYAADHEMYRNCSRVYFCDRQRNIVLDDSSKYAADLSSVQYVGDVATIRLYNANEDELELQISFLSNNQARVKIAEEKSTRHELQYVLDGEPSQVPFTIINSDDNTAALIPTNSELSDVVVIITSGPPFAVKFYYKEHLQVVLNAENLVMQYNETSQPFGFQVEFDGANALYGLFHHAYKLLLGETADGSDEPFRFRNSDVDFYESDSTMALYGAIPVVYGHSGTTGRTSGVFLHNAAEQWIDISYTGERPSAHFMVESATLDLFVFVGPTIKEVIRQYTNITGYPHLPQIWVLGYHQCRWSYYTQEDAKNVVANMDKYDFPMDVLWLDDGHSNGNRYFEWNPVNFTDPVEMQNNISSTGRKIVTILDPHIKIADDYAVSAGGKGKYFVKWANGSDFEGICWPGWSNYIDFFDPEASDYYGSWYSYKKFNLSTPTLAGAWNDMNEPSVFNSSWEKTFPFDVVHYGNIPHRDVHNVYGFMHVRSTHKGLYERDNGTKRPFILTRSHFAGTQRYAAMWTGDNTADWPYLSNSYSECLTANLLGQVLCGPDTAGFFSMPSNELVQRWYQAAIWLPFFRGHSNRDTPRREPYLFPDDVQDVIRTAIKLRYKHIPVFYTLFYQHVLTGDPIIRPLFYHYSELLEYDDHLLLGSDILARPVLESNVTEVTVTLPGVYDYWYRVDDNSWISYPGDTEEVLAVEMTTSPLYYRAGSIISRLDIERRSTTDMVDDPYTLYVNLDQDGHAEGYLYKDDYTSFAYREKNSYFYIKLTYIPESSGLLIDVLGGDPTDIDVTFQRIVVHSINDLKEVKGEAKSYSTTSDGTPLSQIDLVRHLKTQSKGFMLYL